MQAFVRRVLSGLLLLALSACQHAPNNAFGLDFEARMNQAPSWSGRLALRVEQDPVETLSAAFTLKGDEQAGELNLYSPLGTLLYRMRWQAQGAELMAEGKTHRFASFAELSRAATGAALPLRGLFAWMQGQQHEEQGWRVDLSRYAQGRWQAQRESPEPRCELRVILDLDATDERS